MVLVSGIKVHCVSYVRLSLEGAGILVNVLLKTIKHTLFILSSFIECACRTLTNVPLKPLFGYRSSIECACRNIDKCASKNIDKPLFYGIIL